MTAAAIVTSLINEKNTIYEIVLSVLFFTLALLGEQFWQTNVLFSVLLYLLAVVCLMIIMIGIRKIKVWPFTERIDFRYKTIKTIVYSGNYVFTSAAGSNPLNIEYGITADVINRDDFTIHELLDDKNKDKYLKSFVNGVIYTCLACYHVLYEKDGYPRFHKILDINTKNVVINEAPEHINNII